MSEVTGDVGEARAKVRALHKQAYEKLAWGNHDINERLKLLDDLEEAVRVHERALIEAVRVEEKALRDETLCLECGAVSHNAGALHEFESIANMRDDLRVLRAGVEERSRLEALVALVRDAMPVLGAAREMVALLDDMPKDEAVGKSMWASLDQIDELRSRIRAALASDGAHGAVK